MFPFRLAPNHQLERSGYLKHRFVLVLILATFLTSCRAERAVHKDAESPVPSIHAKHNGNCNANWNDIRQWNWNSFEGPKEMHNENYSIAERCYDRQDDTQANTLYIQYPEFTCTNGDFSETVNNLIEKIAFYSLKTDQMSDCFNLNIKTDYHITESGEELVSILFYLCIDAPSTAYDTYAAVNIDVVNLKIISLDELGVVFNMEQLTSSSYISTNREDLFQNTSQLEELIQKYNDHIIWLEEESQKGNEFADFRTGYYLRDGRIGFIIPSDSMLSEDTVIEVDMGDKGTVLLS